MAFLIKKEATLLVHALNKANKTLLGLQKLREKPNGYVQSPHNIFPFYSYVKHGIGTSDLEMRIGYVKKT